MLNYNAPADGQKSSIDGAGSDQMNTFFWLKKAIIESRKEQYFMPLASVSTDKTGNLGNLADGAEKGTLEGHDDAVWAVAWSKDGASLATAGLAPVNTSSAAGSPGDSIKS